MAGTVTTTYPEPGMALVTWGSLSTENGDAASVARWSDKTLHVVSGTGTCTLEGSNDGSTWSTMHDSAGNALTAIAVDTLALIAENPRFVRAVAAGGTLVVSIYGRMD